MSARFRRWGIRTRVTATAAVIVTLTLLVAGIALVALVRWSLIRAIDQSERDQTSTLAAAITAHRLTPTVPSTRSGTTLVQIVDARNRVLAATANIQGEPPILPAAGAGAMPRFSTKSNLPLGAGSFRILSTPVEVHGSTAHIYIATSLTQVDAATVDTAILFSGGLPITIGLLSWVVWRAVRRALGPVEQIRAETAKIQASTLAARVPVPRADDEISRLAVTMNRMLDRLERARRQQTEFVGNASHELKSPLAALRTHLDVALHGETDPPRQAVLSVAQEQVHRMSELIEDLLFLAREHEQPPPHDQLVDLDEIVLAEAARLRSIGRAEVVLDHVDAVRVPGSSRALARMLRNLGDNALQHTRTTVALSIRSDDHEVVITVTDDGPGIPAGERDHVFQRFTRLDEARARPGDSPGTGLGLAIANQIAHDHAGTITIHDRADHPPGTVMQVRVPRRACGHCLKDGG